MIFKPELFAPIIVVLATHFANGDSQRTDSGKTLSDFIDLLAGNLGDAAVHHYAIPPFVKITGDGLRLDLGSIVYKFDVLTKFHNKTHITIPFAIKDARGHYTLTNTDIHYEVTDGPFRTSARATTIVAYTFNAASGKVEANTPGGKYINIKTTLDNLETQYARFIGYTTDYMYDSFSNVVRTVVADTVMQFNGWRMKHVSQKHQE